MQAISFSLWLLFCVGIILLITAVPAFGYADSDPATYAIPLGGGIFIAHNGMGNSQPISNLVLSDNDNGTLRGGRDLVSDVKQLEVTRTYVLGENKGGYFMLDDRPHSNDRQPGGFALRCFSSAGEWQAALKSAGVGAVRLQTPDALAAGFPDQVLRPWNYNVMHALFGLDDGTWSFVVQIAGISTVFLFGLLRRRRSHLVLFPALLGVIVNVVALIVIAGAVAAGPGFIVLPVEFVVAAKLGSLFSKRRQAA